VLGVVTDRVVNLRPAPLGGLETQTDLNAFDGLDAHHGLRQPAVQLAVPLRVAAQPEGQPVDADLDNAAERVAFLADLIDQRHDRRVGFRVQAVNRAGIANSPQLVDRAFARLGPDSAELQDVSKRYDSERREKLLGQRTGCDANRCLPGAGPFQDAADRA